MPTDSKLTRVLQSRKVWASLIALGVTILLWRMGEIDGHQFATAIETITGVFVGAVALEDGLSNVFQIWVHEPDPNGVRHLQDTATSQASGIYGEYYPPAQS